MATRLSPTNLETAKLGYADEENFEILTIDNLTDADWRKSIVNYMENPITSAKRKVRYRSLSYTLIGNELFKKTPEGVLLKCLSEAKAYLAMSNVHSGGMWGSPSRPQDEMDFVSARDVLAYYAERLHRVC